MPYEEKLEALLQKMPHSSHAQVEEAIEQLRNASTIQAESLIVLLLKNLLSEHIKSEQQDIDLNALSNDELGLFLQELSQIAAELAQNSDMSQAEIFDILRRILGRVFGKRTEKEKDKKEQRFEELDEKQKEEIDKELERMQIYEHYKITNPNAIAGETAAENFRNNMIYHGPKVASKHAGGKPEDVQKYPKSYVDRLLKEHQNLKDKGPDFR